jgi:hypothetical protein
MTVEQPERGGHGELDGHHRPRCAGVPGLVRRALGAEEGEHPVRGAAGRGQPGGAQRQAGAGAGVGGAEPGDPQRPAARLARRQRGQGDQQARIDLAGRERGAGGGRHRQVRVTPQRAAGGEAVRVVAFGLAEQPDRGQRRGELGGAGPGQRAQVPDDQASGTRLVGQDERVPAGDQQLAGPGAEQGGQVRVADGPPARRVRQVVVEVLQDDEVGPGRS